MEDQIAIQMMKRCRDEIRMQRVMIERLEPQAEAYRLVHKIVGLLPERSQGHGEDLAWRLDKEIAEIEAKLRAEAKPEEPQP